MRNPLISVLSLAILSACGGGGGSAPEPAPSVPSPTPIPPPAPPANNVFKAQVVSENQCGIEQPQDDAVVIVHNDDFSISSIHYADPEGSIEVDLGTEQATISLIYKTKNISAEETLAMLTYKNMPEVDIGTIRAMYADIADPSCECVTQDVSVTNTLENTSPFLGHINGAPITTAFFNNPTWDLPDITLCKQPDQAWPPVEVSLRYTDSSQSQNRYYVGVTSDYDITSPIAITAETQVIPVPVAFESADSAQFTSITSQGYVSAQASYEYYLTTQLNEGLAVFPTDDVAYTLVSGIKLDNVTVLGESENIVFSSQKYFEQTPSQTTDFTFINKGEVQSALESVDPDGRFDFSGITGMDFAFQSVTVENRNRHDLFRWRIIGDVSGTFNELENFSLEDVDISLNNSSEPWRASVVLAGVNDPIIEGYTEFLEQLGQPPASQSELDGRQIWSITTELPLDTFALPTGQ